MTIASPKLITAEELLAMPDGERFELVNGEIIPMAPAGQVHGRYGFDVVIEVGNFVRARRLGVCFLAETGFLLSRDPDTVRAPDFAFICAGRVPEDHHGFCSVAPDLVVEVLSPSDTAEDINAKIAQWHSFGVRSAWVVSLKAKTITLHYPDGTGRTFRVGETLTDEAVLPGFQLRLADVFQ